MQMPLFVYAILFPTLSSANRIFLVGENFPDLRKDVVRTMGSLRTAKHPESTAFHWRWVSLAIMIDWYTSDVKSPGIPVLRIGQI